MNTDEEYAHTETQHTHLIGDVATADKQAISTLNWREVLKKNLINLRRFAKDMEHRNF